MTDHSPRSERPGQPRRALITGGAGFIGSHLAAALLRRGDHVTVVDDLSTGRRENLDGLDGPVRLVVGDIGEPGVLEPLVRDADVVFHLAAAVGVQRVVEDALGTIRTNVMGTEAVLEAAARHGVKVLVASTSEVYGKCVTLPASEDDDVLIGASRHSRWSYAASKMVDEFLALAYARQLGLPVVVFRLFNTVGPRQNARYGMVVPRFVGAALEGRPLPVHGDGQQSRSFCHVLDAVDGILRLADCPQAEGEVVNIGGSVEITIGDLAERVLTLVTGSPTGGAGVQRIPYEHAYAAGYEDIRRRVADTTKLRRLTGWVQRYSLDDILRDVAEQIAGERGAAVPSQPGDGRLTAAPV